MADYGLDDDYFDDDGFDAIPTSTLLQLEQNAFAVAGNGATTGAAVGAPSEHVQGDDESTMDAEELKSRYEQVGSHSFLAIMAIR